MDSAPTPVHVANEIPADHWLRDPEWSWLLEGLEYAATQTHAIPALSKCSPGEAAHLVLAVMRGANRRAPQDVQPGEVEKLRHALRRAHDMLAYLDTADITKARKEAAEALATPPDSAVSDPDPAVQGESEGVGDE